MQTIVRSLTMAAPRDAVLDVISDPTTLPRWAPAFAERVRPGADGRCVVQARGAEFEIRVVVSEAAGTVDFLATGEDRGLFTRVVPSEAGSDVVFALAPRTGTPPEALAGQGAVLERELEALRRLGRERAGGRDRARLAVHDPVGGDRAERR
jgi:hypothetical protein